MRHLILIALFVCLTTAQSGCGIFNKFRSSGNSLPVVFEQAPDGTQLIAHLNERASRVRQLKSNVKVSMDGIPTLRGTLVVERPQRLRLQAGLLAGVAESGVDVGSNDERFWIWTRASLPGREPVLMYATHAGFQRSALKSAVPVEPRWLIDSIGLTEFTADERHEGPFPRNDGRVEIHTYRSEANGGGIRVCTVDPRTGLVHQLAMYDISGNRIAWANADSYQVYPESGISLPQRMELFMVQPDGNPAKLVVESEKFELNALYGSRDRLFSMPQPEGVQIIDLSSTPIQTAPPQAVGSGSSNRPAAGSGGRDVLSSRYGAPSRSSAPY